MLRLEPGRQRATFWMAAAEEERQRDERRGRAGRGTLRESERLSNANEADRAMESLEARLTASRRTSGSIPPLPRAIHPTAARKANKAIAERHTTASRRTSTTSDDHVALVLRRPPLDSPEPAQRTAPTWRILPRPITHRPHSEFALRHPANLRLRSPARVLRCELSARDTLAPDLQPSLRARCQPDTGPRLGGILAPHLSPWTSQQRPAHCLAVDQASEQQGAL